MATWWCESAWLSDGIQPGVAISADEGVITDVETETAPRGQRLDGLVFPGFANTHSHAFHRALRGRTQEQGDFWSWREAMYRVASLLEPDSYLTLATAVYAEMALAGYTCVGEFHYLHHEPDGRPYSTPNAMGEALIEAAARAGIRLTLLDTCYLAGGIGRALDSRQARFSDGDAAAWAERVSKMPETPQTKIGAAIHSVRAVPQDEIPTVVEAATSRPLHVHVSEQPAENEETRRAFGLSPTGLLAERGALGPNTTVVHATHVSADDLEILGISGTGACICPTTERDLGDGIGPAWELAEAGVLLSVGSDQHAIIDPFEEIRGLELHERLDTGARGAFSPAQLVAILTRHGYRALGWDGGGRIEVGAPCDLVAVDPNTVHTAGSAPEQLIYAATAADVTDVVVGGEAIVAEGKHRLGDVARLLGEAIGPLWQ
ncbi:MAG TPA: formimidoylglutamate deiminase [Acidimicrobiia bacterium]|nr:formimidoylglutamate deiminase [Acidimicrobiia bacterium]